MRSYRSVVAVFCSLLTLAPAFGAEIITPPTTGLPGTRKYRPATIAPVDLTNSGRLETLLRAGNLYLSLQDTVALALENNLDIAISRYGPVAAQTDLLRAQGGGALRGVTQTVTPGPASAGLSLNAFGSGGGSFIGSTSTGVNGVVSQLGTLIPNYDPQLTGFVGWGHNTSPQSTPFLYGTTSLVTTQTTANLTLSQGLPTGGTATLQFQNQRADLNSGRPDLNPLLTSSLSLTFSQPLLSGFGFAVNRRGIHQAQNSMQVQDWVFKQQVMTTVAAVISLYWNLVSFNEQVKVAEQALAASQKLYEDNIKQVEIGTLARISIVQAEAEVASRQQDLTVAQTNVLQQEVILKNVLSKNGIASPSVADAHIVTLDRITIPAADNFRPLNSLVEQALSSRPDLEAARANIATAQISALGTENGVLPTALVFAGTSNAGLAGPAPVTNTVPLKGGIGTALAQVFDRDFPTERLGVFASVPVHNRQASADQGLEQLQLRQTQLTTEKSLNQVIVDISNDLIAVQQARARYEAAVKNRELQQQLLDAEQRKFLLGASTPYNVTQQQRDLATASATVLSAMVTYTSARVALDQATGSTLDVNHVSIGEAQAGKVAAPSTLPANLPTEPLR